MNTQRLAALKATPHSYLKGGLEPLFLCTWFYELSLRTSPAK